MQCRGSSIRRTTFSSTPRRYPRVTRDKPPSRKASMNAVLTTVSGGTAIICSLVRSGPDVGTGSSSSMRPTLASFSASRTSRRARSRLRRTCDIRQVSERDDDCARTIGPKPCGIAKLHGDLLDSSSQEDALMNRHSGRECIGLKIPVRLPHHGAQYLSPSTRFDSLPSSRRRKFRDHPVAGSGTGEIRRGEKSFAPTGTHPYYSAE